MCLLDHSALTRCLGSFGFGSDASELHGSLSGLLCGGDNITADDWPAALELDVDPAWRNDEVVRGLFENCHAMFAHTPPQIQPLLPDVDTATRATALIAWCRGFLGGFGLSGAAARQPLTREADMVLQNLAAIAHFRLDADQADDAASLGSLLDFVRDGAVVLHAQALRSLQSRALH